MIDPNKKEEPPVSASEVCHRAFELMAAKQFADAERLLAGNMSKTDNNTSIALYHSTLGVLYKMQGEFKTAWRHYQRAERLLPKDPALKIISARLLIEQFAEYDQAIRKAKKVLELAKGNPAFAHQAHITMGLAYASRGNRRKAVEMLAKSMGEDFDGFVTAQNIDLNLLEILLRKGWISDECRMYLDKALTFARSTEEEKFVNLYTSMLNAYDEEYVPKQSTQKS
jgi:tetratricopeptide (TPR) repeat protein